MQIKDTLAKHQYNLYEWYNNYAYEHPVASRLIAPGVALIDVAAENLKAPLTVIEYVAKGALSVLQAIFTDRGSIKFPLCFFENAVIEVIKTPVELLFAPVKLFLQTIANFARPQLVNSIQYQNRYGENNPFFHEEDYERIEEDRLPYVMPAYPHQPHAFQQGHQQDEQRE